MRLGMCVPFPKVGTGPPTVAPGTIDRCLVWSSRPEKPEAAPTITRHWCGDEVDNNVTRPEDMATEQHPPSLRLRWPILDIGAHQRERLGADLEVPTSRADKGERLGTSPLALHALPVPVLPHTRQPALR